MKKRIAALLLCTALAVSALGGCHLRGQEKEEKKEDLITVGFSQVGAESDWRIANTESMKEALSEENGFKLLISDAQQ